MDNVNLQNMYISLIFPVILPQNLTDLSVRATFPLYKRARAVKSTARVLSSLCMKLYVLPGRIIYFNPYARTMLSNSVLSAKPSNTLWRLVPDCSLVTQSFRPASSGSLSIIVR